MLLKPFVPPQQWLGHTTSSQSQLLAPESPLRSGRGTARELAGRKCPKNSKTLWSARNTFGANLRGSKVPTIMLLKEMPASFAHFNAAVWSSTLFWNAVSVLTIFPRLSEQQVFLVLCSASPATNADSQTIKYANVGFLGMCEE